MTDTIKTPFYVVWTPGGDSTSVWYGDHGTARREAERLAERDQEKVYYVLSATGFAKRRFPVEWTPMEEIPL